MFLLIDRCRAQKSLCSCAALDFFTGRVEVHATHTLPSGTVALVALATAGNPLRCICRPIAVTHPAGRSVAQVAS